MSDIQNILPQKNSYLLGQEEAEAAFLRAYNSKIMHHAWILSGPFGIGKATLAYRIARFLLSADVNKNDYTSLNISEKSNIFQQVANGSNPDLMVLERDYIDTDRRKIIKAIKDGEPLDDTELANLKKSAYIRVDDVRKVHDFLTKTSYNDNWRIVIIDSADDMNKSAANALLKMLEEPPARTVILLISHNVGTLLPTIRSRCAKLPLNALNDTNVASLLRRYRSDLSEAMIEKLVELCSGSIGKALLYADNDIVGMYEDMCSVLCMRQNYSLPKLLEFAAETAANDDRFAILKELIIKFIKDNMLNAQNPEKLYECWQEAEKGFADCINLNMDKKFMLINLLTKICKVL